MEETARRWEPSVGVGCSHQLFGRGALWELDPRGKATLGTGRELPPWCYPAFMEKLGPVESARQFTYSLEALRRYFPMVGCSVQGERRHTRGALHTWSEIS